MIIIVLICLMVFKIVFIFMVELIFRGIRRWEKFIKWYCGLVRVVSIVMVVDVILGVMVVLL